MDAKCRKFNEQNIFQSEVLVSEDSRYHQTLCTHNPVITFPDSELMYRPINSSGLELALDSTTTLAIPVSSLTDAAAIQDGVSNDMSSSGDIISSPSGDSDSSSDPTLKYITDILLEEDIIDQPYIFDDHIALKATENSFYDAIGQQYPPTVSSNLAYFSPSNIGSNYSEDKTWLTSLESNDNQLFLGTGSVGMVGTSASRSSSPNNGSPTGLNDADNNLSTSNASEMVRTMFSNNESILLFNRGLEEARKFLPEPSQLVDLDSYKPNLVGEEQLTSAGAQYYSLKQEPIEISSRSRKIHERDELDLEGRDTKQSAVTVEEDYDDASLAAMFDKVLLLPAECCERKNTVSDETGNGSKGGKTKTKRQNKKKDSIDLRTQLILCAQAMSASDFRTASELLKQIRLYSSAHGDGSQRLAHYFANGLEARLAGSTGGIRNFFEFLSVKKTTAVELLKAFQTLMCSCPFKKLALVYLNKMIFKTSQHAKTLHIVDYGIIFGYQWPSLIQILSTRPEGPPKLKITAIDLPERGFRPLERIEETGRRLSKYCQRFNVPFEYHPIVEKNWENIHAEDIKICEDEFLVVYCLGRLHNFLDETGEGDCQRDVFLSSIRKMQPDMFCYFENNGSFNSPFFVTRFRESLFHYSAVFDYLDCTLPQDNKERLWLEENLYGREAINVVDCEGLERVTRPETYKQWQVRTTRAGFKELPLDQELMDKCRTKGKLNYHKDFVFDQDGHWLLQGWKGRILCCTSCWVSA